MHDLTTIQKLNRAEIDKARKTAPITDDLITETLTDLVADFGKDYVYPKDKPGYIVGEFAERCVYQLEDGTPACIIGHLLDRLGVDLTVPGDANDPAWGVVSDALLEAENNGRKVETIHVFFGLRDAQVAQDEGKTWGEALDVYLRSA